MKKQISLLLAAIMCLTLAACEAEESPEEPAAVSENASDMEEEENLELPEGFVQITGGEFEMGSPDTEAWRSADETQHLVTVSDFYISVYEVTQEEYQAVMGENPSNFSGENLPVENVTWYDAVAYCNARSEQEGLMPAYTINGTNVADETGAAGEEATEADTQSDTDGEEQETGTYPDGSTPQFSGERLRFTVTLLCICGYDLGRSACGGNWGTCSGDQASVLCD